MPDARRSLVGPIPDPDELFGREELINNLWRIVQSSNILLLAPRRFGKSGVMRHVLKRPKEGYLTIYVDLEEITTPERFVERLLKRVLEHDQLRKSLRTLRNSPSAIGKWIHGKVRSFKVAGHGIELREPLPGE